MSWNRRHTRGVRSLMGMARVLSVITRGATVALVLVLAQSTPALSALWMQISVNPSTPTVGQSVKVTVLTFSFSALTDSMRQNVCWDDPRITPTPVAKWYTGGDSPTSLDLEMVVLNSSQRFTVPLVQRPGNGAYWDGTITFPSGGEWTLYTKTAGAPATPTSADRCIGVVRTVDVQPMGPVASPKAGGIQASSFSGFLVLGGMVLAMAAAAALGMVVFSQRRR
jgi:hypothetical protein